MSSIICFWDKSKLQVSDTIANKLKIAIKDGSIKYFNLEGNLYAVGGVEKIITKDKAFEIFPDEWQQLSGMKDSKGTDNLIQLQNNITQLE